MQHTERLLFPFASPTGVIFSLYSTDIAVHVDSPCLDEALLRSSLGGVLWKGLRRECCRCGNVASAIIEKDVVGNPKGVAVVEFDGEPARKVALTLSGATSCWLICITRACLLRCPRFWVKTGFCVCQRAGYAVHSSKHHS